MKNNYFTLHALNNGEVEDYISAVKELASNIGITIVEDTETDEVVAIFGNHNKITVMKGMHDINGIYRPRWCEAQHNNLPERLVNYAVMKNTAGKKRIRFAKRKFNTRFPQVFDKWMYEFNKGITPDEWVSIV